MSRMENMETGERMMTEGNALRHYIWTCAECGYDAAGREFNI